MFLYTYPLYLTKVTNCLSCEQLAAAVCVCSTERVFPHRLNKSTGFMRFLNTQCYGLMDLPGIEK